MLKKLSTIAVSILALATVSSAAFADLYDFSSTELSTLGSTDFYSNYNFGSDFYFGLDDIPTPAADAFMSSYDSSISSSASTGWTADTTNHVVIPATYQYTSNGDGTSTVTETTGADYSIYGEDEIVKPFKYPDYSIPVKIDFTLDGYDDRITYLVDGKEFPTLDVDPYDNKIYDNYDFDGLPGGKYARTQVGERVVQGWPGYGYIYESNLYAVQGYPTDTAATTTGTSTVVDDTTTVSGTVPADATPVTVNPETGKVYHDPSGVLVTDAHYDKTDNEIYYVDKGTVTTSTFGTMLTATTGYINMGPETFAYFYPESVVSDTDGAGDTTVDTATDTAADSPSSDGPDIVDVSYDSTNFKDVPSGEWYYEPVWYAAAAGWINYDVNFRPNDPMSRCEFAKVLMIAHGATYLDDYDILEFADVPKDHWAFKYVTEGLRQAYWGGLANGDFGCDNSITREQAAKMIANAIGMNETSEDTFTPSDDYSDWALPYIRRMHKWGYMTDKEGVFDAGGNFTRAQAVKVFYRIFKIGYWTGF